MTGRHLVDDELADLDADLLDPVEADEARSHLAACSDCADRFADLGELRSLLRADDPGPMPDDLVARLESALAEAGAAPRLPASVATGGLSAVTGGAGGTSSAGNPARVGSSPAASPGASKGADSGATVTPLRRERRVPTWLSAAAAIAVVVGVGALGVRALSGGGEAGANRSSTGMSAGAGAPEAAKGSAPLAAPTASGRDYSPSTVAADTRLLLAGAGPAPDVRGSAPETAPANGSTPTALAGLAGTGLAACVGQLSDGTPQRPLAVDLASWRGSPAAVIVLPAATADPAYVDVWVVGPACGGPGGADVRHFQRVQR